MTRRTYTVNCIRSQGWWAISIPEVPGAFSQARRLKDVEAMAREAIGLILDVEADSFDVKILVSLNETAAKAIGMWDTARVEARDAAQAERDALHQMLVTITKDSGLTYRDAGALIGLSHQRVEQILNAAQMEHHEGLSLPTVARFDVRSDLAS